jgi:sodium transport system ATP-binding protein
MAKGHIVDSGTLPELAERHEQNDFEELFYQLIIQSEPSATQCAGASQ